MNMLKTIFNGALGALTFGMYYAYTTNKQIEKNNRLIRDKMNNIKKKMI